MYSHDEARTLLVRGLSAPDVYINSPEVLAQLEKIGAVRQPVEMKWYWLFPDEEAKRAGRAIIRRWRSGHPATDLPGRGWGSRPAMPDSRGKYVDHFKDLRGCARGLLAAARELLARTPEDVERRYQSLRRKQLSELREIIQQYHRIYDVSETDKQGLVSDILRDEFGGKRVDEWMAVYG